MIWYLNNMPDLESLATAYAWVFLRMNRAADRLMTERGASLAQTKLLVYLSQNGPARSTDIATFFGHSPRTVTQAIDALERSGLAIRVPDPGDRRAKLVSITESGKAAMDRSEPLRRQIVEQTFGVLSPEERSQLAGILQKLTLRLDASEAPL